MLQRAASNAYSWWMASHIRTKQSKWMEQNLADMEEKVVAVIKLLSEDGDSFMQKAEMYYKKRPELITFVEEFFRGYRALADRYDHLSTELQNANNTIAQICPDQLRGMEDDDDDEPIRFRKKPSENLGRVPGVPKLPVKELKFITSTKKKVREKKEWKAAAAAAAAAATPKSGLTKDEGVVEIDRIQKRILALQTEKEFVKSSYESRLAKYWDVENEIKSMQETVNTLQDEFGDGKVIDDEEARNLMSATALKSCKVTLDQLQETRDRAVTEIQVEQRRIKISRGKLDSLKKIFEPNESIQDESRIGSTKPEPKASHIVEKTKDNMESEVGDNESVTDMVEKVDALVDKVTGLETEVASQTALIQRIRLENDELQPQIQILEDCKTDMTDDEKHDLKMKIKEVELKLKGIQDLNHSLEDQNKNMQSYFDEARSNLDQLSQKVKPVGELETTTTLSVPPKKVPKKAGKEFLAPKVTTSPPDQVESEKESQEQVPTDVTNLSSKKAPKKAGKEFLAPKVTPDQVDESEKGSQEQIPTDVTNELKTLSASPKNKPKKVLKKAGSEFLSPKVTSSPSDEDESEKGSQEQVPTDVTNELKTLSVSPKEADKEFLAPKVTSSPTDQVESEKGSQEQVPTDVSNELKELNSVPEPTNDEGKTGDSHKISAGEKGGGHEISAGETGASHESSEVSDYGEDLKAMADSVGQASSVIANTVTDSESKDNEYAELSQDLKETKKKLMEVEANHQNELFEITLQLKELKSINAKKEEEIRYLRLKLSRISAKNDNNSKETEESKESCEKSAAPTTNLGHLLGREGEGEGEEEEETIGIAVKEPESVSPVEEKFRMNIDELLEENLDFWFRFSSTIYEIQRFETGVKDLEAEVLKLDERQDQEGSTSSRYSIKSDVRPLYKHLKEMQTDLSAWMEKSALLKEELKNRSASLSELQEEITKALKASAEDEEFRFTSYQAAKFQGEILNMKQENKRVADELQAGLDLATSLQHDAEKSINKLSNDWGLAGSKSRQGSSNSSSSSLTGNHSNVPLRSFIFGAKQKKKNSIFSSVVQQRRHRSGH